MSDAETNASPVIQLAVIAQGVAARYARRQASSEKAFMYRDVFPLLGHLAWGAIEDAEREKARL